MQEEAKEQLTPSPKIRQDCGQTPATTSFLRFCRDQLSPLSISQSDCSSCYESYSVRPDALIYETEHNSLSDFEQDTISHSLSLAPQSPRISIILINSPTSIFTQDQIQKDSEASRINYACKQKARYNCLKPQSQFKDCDLPAGKTQLTRNKYRGKENMEGCGCKRTKCLKRYCECYQQGKHCGPSCKCTNCYNQVCDLRCYEELNLREILSNIENPVFKRKRGQKVNLLRTIVP